jgi:flagellin-like protein
MKLIGVDKRGVSPVIGVILMVAITVVLSGLLWSMFNFQPVESRAKNISGTISEKSFGWKIEIAAVSGNYFDLDQITFRVITDSGYTLFKLRTSDSDPEPFFDDLSKVYPLTNGSAVIDMTTGNPVTNSSNFRNYQGCQVAFVDADSDDRITPGDIVYLYKDYNNDGEIDIFPIYSFKIFFGDTMALSQIL